ncbi:SurA N-terminal domain-containing protein [Thalassobacillus pellis]|uniref:SurA N-terminal domain-containing protein n=1 Tax=Thalassobacillus pellis TaxID=748008 RepID=UPI0019616A9E|nr:SurA N-terminal domain-containing protein [Thalassobacillus pellis]MBM7552557.1 peptidyl-prolyl cis-trans isomerase SurA [Thalassobacillus pellis]
MNKKMLSMVFGLLLVLALAACSGNGEEAKQEDKKSDAGKEQATATEDLPEVVAVVNGEKISKDEFTQRYNTIKKQYEQMGMNIDKNKGKVQKSVVDLLVNSELLVQYAEKSGIKVDEKKVDEEYKKITDKIKSEDEMKKFLEANNMSSKEELRPRIKESLVVQKYIEENTETPEVTEKEMKKQYDTMVAQMEKQGKNSEQKPEIPAYEEAKPRIKQQLQNSKQQEQVKQLLEKLRKDSEVEVKI